ncbi:helix-turn-helix domain-containing protein [Pirellulaceae bacterium SH467]
MRAPFKLLPKIGESHRESSGHMGKRGVVLNGELLTKLYTRRGWSQQEFAMRAGVDARTIAKIKKGGSCDTRTLQILSGTLKVSPESLLAEDARFDALAAKENDEAAESKLSSGIPRFQRFRLQHLWKIVDFRRSNAGEPDAVAQVWNWYRIQKLSVDCDPYVFPFLTWGEGIECDHAPSGVSFQRVGVLPGDLVHSNKQWEISITPPEGGVGTAFDCGPIGLRYVDAFFREGQQWWQTRITDETDVLLIQLWFRPEQCCKQVFGEWAPPGGHRFQPMEACPPQRNPDGEIVTWMIQKPMQGAFYKLSWGW